MEKDPRLVTTKASLTLTSPPFVHLQCEWSLHRTSSAYLPFFHIRCIGSIRPRGIVIIIALMYCHSFSSPCSLSCQSYHILLRRSVDISDRLRQKQWYRRERRGAAAGVMLVVPRRDWMYLDKSLTTILLVSWMNATP